MVPVLFICLIKQRYFTEYRYLFKQKYLIKKVGPVQIFKEQDPDRDLEDIKESNTDLNKISRDPQRYKNKF
jgi:hypothetical protein